MKNIQAIIPKTIHEITRIPYHNFLKVKYSVLGRGKKYSETSKAKQRRIREKFFEKYCQGTGIDIGYGGDLLSENCDGWDFEHGDAQYMKSIEDSLFDFVYSSHTLEHMINPEIALKNWWRILKRAGYLILYLPHRELYEKKKILPSYWSADHKHFFLIDKDENPDTIGIVPLIQRTLSNFKIVYAKECNQGHTISDPSIHSNGEYSIELVVRKK